MIADPAAPASRAGRRAPDGPAALTRAGTRPRALGWKIQLGPCPGAAPAPGHDPSHLDLTARVTLTVTPNRGNPRPLGRPGRQDPQAQVPQSQLTWRAAFPSLDSDSESRLMLVPLD